MQGSLPGSAAWRGITATQCHWEQGKCPHLYLGCSEVSEGDRSGTERDVDDSVVAMEAVVASSKEGGVQGSRSGLPAGPEQGQGRGRKKT